MNINRRSFGIAGLVGWVALSLPVLISQTAWGQGDVDFIGQLRLYPPHLLQPETNEYALESISWKRQQLEGTLAEIESEVGRLNAQQEKLQVEIGVVSDSLPPGFRFANATTRSELAGRLVEEILNARLELATCEATVEGLLQEKESAAAQLNKVNRTAAAVALRTAEMQLQVAAAKLEQQQKLKDKGFVPESEVLNSRMEVGLAEAELENVRASMSAESDQVVADFAQRIADQRIMIHAVQARMKAAEQALAKFSESVPQLGTIDSLQAEWNSLVARKQFWSAARSRLDQETWELKNLERMLRTHMEKKQAGEPEKASSGDQ